jgi:hypothetical protein
MAINDFILVVGDGWIEIQNATHFINTTTGEAQMLEMIGNGEYPQISQYLEDAGFIEPNTTISNARMINTGATEDNLRMWYVL